MNYSLARCLTGAVMALVAASLSVEVMAAKETNVVERKIKIVIAVERVVVQHSGLRLYISDLLVNHLEKQSIRDMPVEHGVFKYIVETI